MAGVPGVGGVTSYAGGDFGAAPQNLQRYSAALVGAHDQPENFVKLDTLSGEIKRQGIEGPDHDAKKGLGQDDDKPVDFNMMDPTNRPAMLPPMGPDGLPILPPLRHQVTIRALLIGFVLAGVFSIVTLKLDLTAGIIPGFATPAALIGFAAIKGWLWVANKFNWGFATNIPFNRQENTVIQTFVSAGSDLAFSGGYGSYYLALDANIANNIQGQDGNDAGPVYKLQFGKTLGYGACIAFLGLFVVLQLRKTMVITWRLPWPGAAASGVLLNAIHTPRGEKDAWRMVIALFIAGFTAFFWDFFEWFFGGSSGPDSSCGAMPDGTSYPVGFGSFPNLGLSAAKWDWYYDNELTYIGCGIIVPQSVNYSMMCGAVLTWGILWPIFNTKAGVWYPAGLSGTNVRGLYGYKIFLALAVFLGDGCYNFIKVTYVSITGMIVAIKKQRAIKAGQAIQEDERPRRITLSSGLGLFDALETEEERVVREKVFMSESFPWWLSVAGYCICGGIAAGTIPQIYAPAKWYYIIVMWVIAPIFSVINSYGAGLTDWNVASTYGKLCIVIFAAWGGQSNGGVVAGLTTCGVMLAATNAACGIMGDFKTGYYTCASPRGQFITQFLGEAAGVFLAPACFWLYYSGYADLGTPGTTYPAPYATVYRALAAAVVGGTSNLPDHCMTMFGIFFGAAFAICLIKDISPPKIRWLIPIPMAAALPFYLGAWLAVDFVIGGVIFYIWAKINRPAAFKFAMPVAAGLIAGEGVWSLPSAILGVANVQPPICMGFLPSNGYIPGPPAPPGK